MMTRRHTLLRSLVLVATVGASLATAAWSAPPPASPRVTLTMWCSPYATEAGWAIQMVRRWNRTHPDVQVRLRKMPGGRVAEDVLREAVRSRTTPDVCTHMFPANVHEFVTQGGLLPLDGHAALMAASRTRSGEASEFRSPDGRLYQIPWKCNPIMLQYNRSLLADAPPPRTYRALLTLAETLRKRGIQAWAPAPVDRWYARYYDFYPLYLAASGGRPFLDGGRLSIDTRAATEALGFVRESFERGYAPCADLYPDAAAQNRAFVEGRLAFLVTGPWNIQLISEQAGDTLRFGFTPMVVPDGVDPTKPVCTYGNFRNISIFSTCKHPAEAAALVRFLISRESDRLFLEATSELPYRRDLGRDPAFHALLARMPHLVPFARQIAWVRPVGNTPYFNRILAVVSRFFDECAVKRSLSPEQAVQGATEAIERLLRDDPKGTDLEGEPR